MDARGQDAADRARARLTVMTEQVTVLTVAGPADGPAARKLLASARAAGSALARVIVVSTGLVDADDCEFIPEGSSDERILTILDVGSHSSWAVAWDAGLAAVETEWLMALAVDDEVLPNSVAELEWHLRLWGPVDALYGDEIVVAAGGDEVVRRHAWSLEANRHVDLPGPAAFIRTEAVRRVGGWQPRDGQPSVQGLLSRIAEGGGWVDHAPHPIVRRRTLVRVESGPSSAPNVINAHSSISIVIPSRGTLAPTGSPYPHLIEVLVSSLEATIDPHDRQVEYVVVCDEGFPAPARAGIGELASRPVRWVEHRRGEEGFNFARMVNEGAWAASGDVLLFVNDDVEMLSHHWVDEVRRLVVDPDVGAVGALLLFPDGRIQHAGMTIQPAHGGWPAHLGYEVAGTRWLESTWACAPRDALGVTGAFLAVPRSAFLRVGAFSEAFPINHNDVDLCLKLRSMGYRNVVTPLVRARHAESSSRTPGATDAERASFAARWGSALRSDPYRTRRLSWRDVLPVGARD